MWHGPGEARRAAASGVGVGGAAGPSQTSPGLSVSGRQAGQTQGGQVVLDMVEWVAGWVK